MTTKRKVENERKELETSLEALYESMAKRADRAIEAGTWATWVRKELTGLIDKAVLGGFEDLAVKARAIKSIYPFGVFEALAQNISKPKPGGNLSTAERLKKGR